MDQLNCMITGVAGFPGYFVTSDGQVIGKNGEERKQHLDSNGYPRISLRKPGSRKLYTHHIHRIVAVSFLPNQEKKRTVNHKDGNPKNNRLQNLEWATDSENQQHAYNTGLRTAPFLGKSGDNHNKSKAVVSIDCEGNETRYGSQREAARAMGISQAAIQRAVSGVYKTSCGFEWRHA